MINDYLSDKAIEKIKAEISSSGGDEVFFIAATDNSGIICEIDAVAYGNESSVPVILREAYDADWVIHNHPSGNLSPSNADLNIASHLGEQGIGFAIVDNPASNIKIVVKPVKQRKVQKIKISRILTMLSDGGLLSQKMKNYENRPSQIEMLQIVSEAFNNKFHALIEAGTGTGKSLAYLLPAISWAVKNHQKVIISTNTINLQEQLINKDIPFLKQALNIKFESVLVKGRGNYLCLRRLHSVISDAGRSLIETEETEIIRQVYEFSKTCEEGSRSELGTITVPFQVWEKVNSDNDTCTRIRCANYTDCFFFKARQRMIKADILVVNHHILCSDLQIRHSKQSYDSAALLPIYKKVVIDEAHNLEDAASSFFSSSITRFGFMRLINSVYSSKSGIEKGIIPFAANLLQTLSASKSGLEGIINRIHDEILPLIASINIAGIDFFKVVHSFAVSEGRQYGRLETKLRLKYKTVRAESFIETVSPYGNKLADHLNGLGEFLNEMYAVIMDNWEPDEDDSEIEGRVKEVESVMKRLSHMFLTLNSFLTLREQDYVYWTEIRDDKSDRIVHLNMTPLDISETMYKALFEPMETVVLTSATLSSAGSFEFIKGRLGLHLSDREVEQKILPSPFNYKEQVSFCIAADMPSPQDRATYQPAVNEYVKRIVAVAEGSTIVLFTAFSSLLSCRDYLAENINLNRIEILAQGTMNRHLLLQKFISNGNSILLGVDSFWEGIDVPGDALRCVVLTRLPFSVPSEPIIEARIEKINEEGGNAFMEYSIPQAIIKFKQGFGRLIRSKSDTGVIVCLDQRILTKQYGRMFLQSLPECNLIKGEMDDILPAVRQYF